MSKRPVEYDATEQFLLDSLMNLVTSRKAHRETVGGFTFVVSNVKAGVKVRVTNAAGAVVHQDTYERVFGLYDVTSRIDADLNGEEQ